MYTMFCTSKSAMESQQSKLDLISNNIANAGTTGYKKLSSSFQDLYTHSLNKLGVPASDDIKETLYVGSGVKSTDAVRIRTQGSLTNTGLKTDLAIDGEGLFKVYKLDGTVAYTRNGNFKVDASGNLVDNNGNRLSITDDKGNELNVLGGPINFGSDEFTIDKDGSVSLMKDGDKVKFGNVKTYKTVGDVDFISIGENLFTKVPGSTVVETLDRDIYQGFTEKSNVNITTEMTDMIVTQRAFQLSTSALQTADEMWKLINNIR